ncbi:MAG: hypothetical protein RLZ07_928 [Pseudomonadota bacterium]
MFLSKCISGIRGAMPTRFTAVSILALTALVSSVESGGNAIANGESRTISIYHTHTGESLTVEYKRNGSFDRDALEKLNWLLRDWRRDEPTSMDPRLFDIVWEAQRSVGSTEPINVVSAYRSPQTNAMLRRQSKAVAKNSQHMLGKAMDFYLTDANTADVREVGLRMQRGGVGYYPNAYTPFVHLDAGSVRHWPRMSHDELARLFPDGKTVHIPSDGRPLERYAEAEQEILANGGTVLGTSLADAGEGGITSKPKSLWAVLFGGGNTEDDESEVIAQKPVSRVAVAKATPSSDEEAPDTPEAAITRKPTQSKPLPMAALPPLSSFKMAKAAPKAPMPQARPGSQPLLALNSSTPQLVWQSGAQPLANGAARPLPALIPLRGAIAASVPLPPIREKTTARVAALTADDGPATTASLGSKAKKSALPPLMTDARSKPAPTIALAYAPINDTAAPTAPAPRSKTASPSEAAKLGGQKPAEPKPANIAALPASKTLSTEAVNAARMPASTSTTRFSMADDPAPSDGHFSTKNTAVCSAKAVAAGQACIPNASR